MSIIRCQIDNCDDEATMSHLSIRNTGVLTCWTHRSPYSIDLVVHYWQPLGTQPLSSRILFAACNPKARRMIDDMPLIPSGVLGSERCLACSAIADDFVPISQPLNRQPVTPTAWELWETSR